MSIPRRLFAICGFCGLVYGAEASLSLQYTQTKAGGNGHGCMWRVRLRSQRVYLSMRRLNWRRTCRALAEGLLDFVYPPRCVGCERGIPAHQQPLCIACIRDLERVDVQELETHIRLNNPDFPATTLFALWMFDKGGRLQRAQHKLKYGQRPAYGRTLGAALASGWHAHAVLLPDLVVPLPLHRSRQLERGYNQSTMLAEGLCRTLGVPVEPRGLRRSRPTKSQTGLDRDARRANVADVFEGDPARLSGKQVLLIDDVITTGATAASALNAAKAAGAVGMHFAALAHART